MNHTNVVLSTSSDFSGWRAWTRKLLHDGVTAEAIRWSIKTPPDLYAAYATRVLPEAPSPTSVPRSLAELFPAVFASEDPTRFSLLYRTLENLRDDTPVSDELMSRLHTLAAETRERALALRSLMPDARDPGWKIIHATETSALIDSQASTLANLRPTPWALLSPDRTLCWDGQELKFGPGLTQEADNDSTLREAAREIATAGTDNAWWDGLAPVRLFPEATSILSETSLSRLRGAAMDCRMCDLCRHAIRTVSGEGNSDARLIFVGEQPGDQEDLQGRPFVGPAGQLFDRALHEAGGKREDAWITNAVKHFKFVARGRRRIHQKPGTTEMQSCAPWLAAERRILAPKVTVMLGVTGASAVLGRPVTVSRERSRLLHLEDGSIGLVTVHPSYLLRLPDEETRSHEYTKFVTDLRMAISALAG